MAGLLYEFVAVATAFEDAGFDAAGTIRHFALGDPGRQREAVGGDVLRCDPTTHPVGPGTESILARSREANLARSFVISERRGRRRRADQVIGRQRRPQFPPHHLRRLAAHVVQIQILPDRADVEFRVPAEAVQFGEVGLRVDRRVGQRRSAWSRS